MTIEVAVNDLIPLRRLLIEARDRLKYSPAFGSDWGDHMVRPDIVVLEKLIVRINRAWATRYGLSKMARKNMEAVFS